MSETRALWAELRRQSSVPGDIVPGSRPTRDDLLALNAADTNTPADRHRAGRWVLAVADLNRAQMLDIMDELRAEPVTLPGFLFELAWLNVVLAEKHVGPDWRSRVGFDLLELEQQIGPA